jgi:hypothetical protein
MRNTNPNGGGDRSDFRGGELGRFALIFHEKRRSCTDPLSFAKKGHAPLWAGVPRNERVFRMRSFTTGSSWTAIGEAAERVIERMEDMANGKDAAQ